MKTIGFTPRSTIRETVSSALAGIGRNWGDVVGLRLNMGEEQMSSADDLWDWYSGEVPHENIDAVLDLDTGSGRKWGGDTHGYNTFDLVLWLEDCTIRFSEQYDTGDYTECRVTPLHPSAEHLYEGRTAPTNGR